MTLVQTFDQITTARELDLRDVVSSKVIADRLGIQSATVSSWSKGVKDFPTPLHTPGVTTPLYSWAEVQRWLDSRAYSHEQRRNKQRAKLLADLQRIEAKESQLRSLLDKAS